MADNQITPFQLTDQFTMDNFNQRINETNTALQNKLGGIESTDYPGCYYRMVSGVVEWFNPPMNLDKEYRITERYLGKPVYVKAVDFKELPNATTKDVPHGITNIENVISAGGTISEGGTIPYHTDWNNIDVGANKNAIFIKTIEDQSDKTAVTWISYTKTTD